MLFIMNYECYSCDNDVVFDTLDQALGLYMYNL